MSANQTPEGFGTVTPMLAVRGAARAIEWYRSALGAAEIMRLEGPPGRIAHAEIRIGNSIVMLAEESPGFNHSPQEFGGSTVNLGMYVSNVDEVIARAVAQGAKLLIPLTDQFYGDRSGRIEDPFGHVWIISTHVEDVSPAEMQRRFDEMMAKKP